MNTNPSTQDNNENSLKIYQKYLELIYYSNDIVRKYPKSENFALVNEIKTSLYSGLRSLMYAIKYKYITMQNYQTWSTLITDICNMLGGWISSCLKR